MSPFKFLVGLFINVIFHLRQALLCYIKIVSFSCLDGAGNIAKQVMHVSEAIQFPIYIPLILACHHN